MLYCQTPRFELAERRAKRLWGQWRNSNSTQGMGSALRGLGCVTSQEAHEEGVRSSCRWMQPVSTLPVLSLTRQCPQEVSSWCKSSRHCWLPGVGRPTSAGGILGVKTPLESTNGGVKKNNVGGRRNRTRGSFATKDRQNITDVNFTRRYRPQNVLGRCVALTKGHFRTRENVVFPKLCLPLLLQMQSTSGLH